MATKKKTTRARGGGYRYRRTSESGDKVYFFGGGSPAPSERSERIVERDISSAPMRDSGPPRRSNAGGMIIGLALLGGAAAAVYYYYTISKCSTQGATKCENGSEYTCKPFPMEELRLWDAWQKTGTCDDGGGGGGGGGACVNGDKKCIGTTPYICQDEQWVQGGDKDCSGGSSCSTPDPQCIEGATKCNSSRVKVQCQESCWQPIGQCAPSDCLGFTCNPSDFECDGNVLLFDAACNPDTRSCEATRSNPNDPICMDSSPYYLDVQVNGLPSLMGGYPNVIEISAVGGCDDGLIEKNRRSQFGTNSVTVVMRDRAERLVEGASIKITPLTANPNFMFIHPEDTGMSEYQDMRFYNPCGAWDYPLVKSMADGTLEADFIVTWNITGTRKVFRFRVTASKDGKSVYQDVSIAINGTSKITQKSCEAWWGGSEVNCDVG